MDRRVFEEELKKIVEISKGYGAQRVYLFGSCLNNIDDARDIDIAVSGVRPGKFFEMYGEILGVVDSSVDLLPLENTREYLANRILNEGKVLYERRI